MTDKDELNRQPERPTAKDPREGRLAQALRTNLRRRKRADRTPAVKSTSED